MGKDSKELLLLKDLYARIPYGVKICYTEHEYGVKSTWTIDYIIPEFEQIVTKHPYGKFSIKDIKPYLRPLSSMTEEEMEELEKITYHTFKYKKGDCEIWTNSYHRVQLFNGAGELYGAGEPTNMLCSSSICIKLIDWLNAHHFDYRGLIEKGLALKAPKGMYKL
jgi:hypothetical protein